MQTSPHSAVAGMPAQTTRLLRAYTRGLVLDVELLDDGGTNVISRRDQQHKGALGRIRQHLANALFYAGDLCHPRNHHRALRVIELKVAAAPVNDGAAYIAEPYVIERWPVKLPDGDTHHNSLLIHECVQGHDDGRPAGHARVRFSGQKSADDAHAASPMQSAILRNSEPDRSVGLSPAPVQYVQPVRPAQPDGTRHSGTAGCRP